MALNQMYRVRDHYPDPFYASAINRLYQIRTMTEEE